MCRGLRPRRPDIEVMRFVFFIKSCRCTKAGERCSLLHQNTAFTTSYLYPHNAYLSSMPLTQHNIRIKRTFRPQACRNPCKTSNACGILLRQLACPQGMPQCANAYHGENHSRPCPLAGIFCTEPLLYHS